MQVSFIIPVYNQVGHTRRCLEALETNLNPTTAHEIILINDGSTAETRSFLDTLPETIRVEHLPENQGFAAATNHGAGIARGRWLCLLNNDVEITPDSIEDMLAAKQLHPDAGVIGNVQVSTESGDVDHAGIRFIDGGYPVHDRPSAGELTQRPDVESAYAVTAACCLVDRPWFNNIGGFDTDYQNGFEDVDLCLRAREAGWGVYISNRSVVKHAVSASQGRGRFEYRNARKFLQRWGPRTAALQIESEQLAAKQFRRQRAANPGPAEAPPPVRAARARIRAEAAKEDEMADTPPTVWIDLLRMEPRGANGGIKPLTYGLLREMTQLEWKPLRFVIFAQEALRGELEFIDEQAIIATRHPAGWQMKGENNLLTTCTTDEIKASHPADVLYCPFGTSEFARPDLPSVCLLVDALHQDLPSALPIEEVNFREDNFKRIIGSATWIQTLARHGTERLGHHYGLHPTRCFHTYAAVHREIDPNATAPTPGGVLPTSPFFFYPANFWPHKNHEVLLTAYRLYRIEAGEAAWPLLLTGHPDRRMESLRTMSVNLGMADTVTFAGHLPDEDFTAVWQQAGALVFPSLHEGFGIPLVEAFQAGLPVAASRASVLPEVGGDACAWFDPRDPTDLASTLVTISRDAQLRESLSAKGKARLPLFHLHYEAGRLNHFLHAAARNLMP